MWWWFHSCILISKLIKVAYFIYVQCFEQYCIANNKHHEKARENLQKERKPLPFFFLNAPNRGHIGGQGDAQQELHPTVADTRCWSAWLRIWATLCCSPTGKALLLMTTFSCFLDKVLCLCLCWALCVVGLVLAGELFTIRSSHLMFTTVWPILTDQNQINV